MRAVILAILCVLVPLPALSAPASCREYVKSRDPNHWLDDRDVCYCGSQLSNLTVTLPPGLRVEAVCGLSINDPKDRSVHRSIDLAREKLSLDSYHHGDYPKGHIYLSGTMQTPITGTVTTEEGPAGSLWFNAKPNRRGPIFWEYHLKTLGLGTDEHYKKLRAPTLAVTQGECWKAEATIRIRNPSVLLGDTDEAGTGADFDVIRVSEYRLCETPEDRSNPVGKLIKDQPEDVIDLIIRIVGCNSYQGEWPYAEAEEKKEIAAQLAKFDCQDLAKEEGRIKAEYVGKAKVIRAIDAAKALEYYGALHRRSVD